VYTPYIFLPIHSPNTPQHAAKGAKLSHQGMRKFAAEAKNKAPVYVTVLRTRNTSVTKPDKIRPKMFVNPTMEINMAACDVGMDFETARSGIKVKGTD